MTPIVAGGHSGLWVGNSLKSIQHLVFHQHVNGWEIFESNVIIGSFICMYRFCLNLRVNLRTYQNQHVTLGASPQTPLSNRQALSFSTPIHPTLWIQSIKSHLGFPHGRWANITVDTSKISVFSPSSGLGSSSLRDTTNIQPNIPKLPLCQARVSVERVAAGRGLSLVWGGTSPLGCQLLVNSLEAWWMSTHFDDFGSLGVDSLIDFKLVLFEMFFLLKVPNHKKSSWNLWFLQTTFELWS